MTRMEKTPFRRNDVIPYFQSPTYSWGPFHIDGFGICVAVGVYIAYLVNSSAARKRGLSDRPMADYAFWGLLGGLVGAHFMHLFAYHREELTRYGPLQILKVWDGLSSTGGVFGAGVAAWIFFKREKIRFNAYGDAFALGVPVGWAIARIGCFLVHDHPGVRTNFFLAVNFPGGARHDLGLDDAILLFAISGVLWAVTKADVLRGRRLGLLTVLYGVGRFLLDFLRAQPEAGWYVDARYGGLTPAQYFCILLVGYGVARLLIRPSDAPANLNQTAPKKGAAA